MISSVQRHSLLLVLPLVAALAQPSAQPVPLTLDSAIQAALERDPGLRAAAGRSEAASGRALQAKAWPNPELELRAEDWPVRGGRGFSDSKKMVGIAQTLPFPGKRSLDARIGKAGLGLAEAELGQRRMELIREVKQGFARALAAGRSLEVSTELAIVAESSASTARSRVEAGAAAYQEQLRAEIQLEQARAELADRRLALDLARQGLATLIGLADLRSTPLQGDLAERADEALLAASSAQGSSSHPRLGAAEARLREAELGTRRAGMESYPDLRVSVAGGRTGDGGQSLMEMGLSLPLPLTDRGTGLRKEARANQRVAEAELDSARRHLAGEIALAARIYREAATQAEACRARLLPKAAEALRLVKSGFEQGKFGINDLLDTQRSHAEARLAYQQRLLELNLAQAELEALVAPRTP